MTPTQSSRATEPSPAGPGRRSGTPETNRTSDLPLRRGLLYPLSYRGIPREILPERSGALVQIITHATRPVALCM